MARAGHGHSNAGLKEGVLPKETTLLVQKAASADRDDTSKGGLWIKPTHRNS